MATTRDLIISAYRVAGIISATEVPEANETSFALDQLNNLIDTWQISELYPYTTIEVSGNFTANKSTYTIGTGAEIDAPRPLNIRTLAFIDGQQYYPIEQISVQDYDNSCRTLDSNGYPISFCYRPNMPNGQIDIYPLPDKDYAYKLTMDFVQTAYTINDTISLPNGYYGALEYNLAVLLSASFGKEVSMIIKTEADNRLMRIKQLNTEPSVLRTANFRRYDIYTDSYR